LYPQTITKEFYIRKTTHPHPCPLPSRERGLKNLPSLFASANPPECGDGRGLRGGCLNVALLIIVLVSPYILSGAIHV